MLDAHTTKEGASPWRRSCRVSGCTSGWHPHESGMNLFPDAATPAVFAAGEPFWIGYGFVAEPGGRRRARTRSTSRRASSCRSTV